MTIRLDPPIRVLMGPGPSDIHPRVLAALAKGTVGHLDPYYLQLMDEMQALLRAIFRTKNRMTLAVSGTGSAGMEAAVVNLIEPGDAMVVCVNGVFGGRMADVAERAGAKVTKIERPWGEVFTPTTSSRRSPRPSPRSSASSWPRPRPAPGSRSRRSPSSSTTPARCCWSTP